MGGGEDRSSTSGPRTWYYGDHPWSGDGDFLAWQRRKRSLNRWDAILAASLVMSVIVGAGIWRLTGNGLAARAAFVGLLLVALGAGLRKWYWEHTGD